jgi:hypothetical protein
MLPAVASEWAIVWREWHAGFYPAWLYALIKLSVEVCVLRLLPSILFGAVFYALMGLRRELAAFFLFQLTLALANATAGLYCSAIGTALPAAPGAAALLAVVTMLISTTLSGVRPRAELEARWAPPQQKHIEASMSYDPMASGCSTAPFSMQTAPAGAGAAVTLCAVLCATRPSLPPPPPQRPRAQPLDAPPLAVLAAASLVLLVRV